MKTTLTYFISLCSILIAIIVVPIGKFDFYQHVADRAFVTSTPAIYCYTNGRQPGTLKNKTYAATPQLCGCAVSVGDVLPTGRCRKVKDNT